MKRSCLELRVLTDYKVGEIAFRGTGWVIMLFGRENEQHILHSLEFVHLMVAKFVYWSLLYICF